ncbi:unnamed protein product [Prunus armeniaca]
MFTTFLFMMMALFLPFEEHGSTSCEVGSTTWALGLDRGYKLTRIDPIMIWTNRVVLFPAQSGCLSTSNPLPCISKSILGRCFLQLGLDSLRSDLRPSPLNGLWNSALDEALTNNENFWKPTSLVHAFLVVSILLKKIVTCGANIYLTSKLFLVRGGAAAPPCAFVDLPVVLVKGPCMPEFD